MEEASSDSHILSFLGAAEDTSSIVCKVAICIPVVCSGLKSREIELYVQELTASRGQEVPDFISFQRLAFMVSVPKVNLPASLPGRDFSLGPMAHQLG